MSRPAWLPDWTGQPVAVIASGPSVTHAQVDVLCQRGVRTIVVNRGYEIAPWADILYAADAALWVHYREARLFPRLKIGSDTVLDVGAHKTRAAALMFTNHYDIRAISIDRGGDFNFDGEPIGYGGCSGFQAANIAVLTRGNPIIAIGFDYVGKHWHPDHKQPLRNPLPESMEVWAGLLDKQADALKKRGIRLINCSPSSILKRYPKMTVEEALA